MNLYSTQTLLLTDSKTKFKTSIGGYFTILHIIVSVLILISLSLRNFQKVVSSDKIEFLGNQQPIQFLFKAEESIYKYYEWFQVDDKKFEFRIHSCSIQEYDNFFSNKTREEGLFYGCWSFYPNKQLNQTFENRNILAFIIKSCMSVKYNDNFVSEKCSKIEDYDSYDIMMKFKGEIYYRYAYYEEESLQDNLNYTIESYPVSNLLNQQGTITINAIKTYVDNDIWNTNFKLFESLETSQSLLSYDYEDDFISITIKFNTFNIKQISTEKINERIISIISVLDIANIIIILISNIFSRYYFKLHVLKTCFNKDDLKSIIYKLSLYENLDDKNLESNDKMVNTIMNKVLTFKNYIFSYALSNSQCDNLETIINNRLSVENLLQNNRKLPGEIGQISNITSKPNDSFFKKFDFLSSQFSLRINGKSKSENKFGMILTVIQLGFLGFLIYYFGYNFILDANPTTNYYVTNSNDQNVIDNFSLNYTLIVTLTEKYEKSTRPVMFDYENDNYKVVNYRYCNSTDLSPLKDFNITYPSDQSLSYLCFDFDDLYNITYEIKEPVKLMWLECLYTKDLVFFENMSCKDDDIQLNEDIFRRFDLISHVVSPIEKEYKNITHYGADNYFINYEDFYIGERISHVFEINTRIDKMRLNKNKLFHNYKDENLLVVNYFKSYKSFTDKYKTYFYIDIYFDPYIKIMTRTNDTFQNCLAIILNINTVVFLIFTFFHYFPSNYYLIREYAELISKEVLEEKFEDYKIFYSNTKIDSKGKNAGKDDSFNLSISIEDNNLVNDKVKNQMLELKVQQKINKKYFENKLTFINYLKYINKSAFTKEEEISYAKAFETISSLISFENICFKNISKRKNENNDSFFIKIDQTTTMTNYITVNNQSVYKTTFGGILSTIYFALIPAVFYIFGRDFFNKTNPTITSKILSFSDLEKINVTFSNLDPKIVYYIKKDYRNYYNLLNAIRQAKDLEMSTSFEIPIDYTCDSNYLTKIYNVSREEIDTNEFQCFEVKNTFPYFYDKLSADKQNIYLEVDYGKPNPIICTFDDNCLKHPYGVYMNYTIADLYNYKDVFKNKTDHYHIEKKEKKYMESIYNEFQYNILQDNKGDIFDNYVQYEYLIKSIGYKFHDYEVFYFSQIDCHININEMILLYTRNYQKVLAVIRESFSILVVIAAVFRLVAQLVSDYYCEKYLFKYFADNNLFHKENNISEVDEYYSNNHDDIVPKVDRLNNKHDNDGDVVNYKFSINNDVKDLKPKVISLEEKYKHNFFDYLLDYIYLTFMSSNEYINLKDQMNRKLSVEHLI